MRKILFTGDNLSNEERKLYYQQGFQIDAYGTDLTQNQIVDLVNNYQFDGYILGGQVL